MGNTDKKRRLNSEDIQRAAVGKLFNNNVKIDNREAAGSEGERYKSQGYVDNMAALFEDTRDDVYKDYITKTSVERGAAKRPRDLARNREKTAESERSANRHGDKFSPPRGELAGAGDDGLIDVEYVIPIRDVLYAYKYVIAGIIFAVILIFAFLVLRINTVTKQYNDLKVAMTESTDYKNLSDELSFEVDDLRQQVVGLTTERDALRISIDELSRENPGNTADGVIPDGEGAVEIDVNQTPASAPTPASTPLATTNADGQRIHVVQTGENFWSISEKYYGSGAKDQEIMAANGYTDPASLQIGAKIIIP